MYGSRYPNEDGPDFDVGPMADYRWSRPDYGCTLTPEEAAENKRLMDEAYFIETRNRAHRQRQLAQSLSTRKPLTRFSLRTGMLVTKEGASFALRLCKKLEDRGSRTWLAYVVPETEAGLCSWCLSEDVIPVANDPATWGCLQADGWSVGSRDHCLELLDFLFAKQVRDRWLAV